MGILKEIWKFAEEQVPDLHETVSDFLNDYSDVISGLNLSLVEQCSLNAENVGKITDAVNKNLEGTGFSMTGTSLTGTYAASFTLTGENLSQYEYIRDVFGFDSMIATLRVPSPKATLVIKQNGRNVSNSYSLPLSEKDLKNLLLSYTPAQWKNLTPSLTIAAMTATWTANFYESGKTLASSDTGTVSISQTTLQYAGSKTVSGIQTNGLTFRNNITVNSKYVKAVWDLQSKSNYGVTLYCSTGEDACIEYASLTGIADVTVDLPDELLKYYGFTPFTVTGKLSADTETNLLDFQGKIKSDDGAVFDLEADCGNFFSLTNLSSLTWADLPEMSVTSQGTFTWKNYTLSNLTLNTVRQAGKSHITGNVCVDLSDISLGEDAAELLSELFQRDIAGDSDFSKVELSFAGDIASDGNFLWNAVVSIPGVTPGSATSLTGSFTVSGNTENMDDLVGTFSFYGLAELEGSYNTGDGLLSATFDAPSSFNLLTGWNTNEDTGNVKTYYLLAQSFRKFTVSTDSVRSDGTVERVGIEYDSGKKQLVSDNEAVYFFQEELYESGGQTEFYNWYSGDDGLLRILAHYSTSAKDLLFSISDYQGFEAGFSMADLISGKSVFINGIKAELVEFTDKTAEVRLSGETSNREFNVQLYSQTGKVDDLLFYGDTGEKQISELTLSCTSRTTEQVTLSYKVDPEWEAYCDLTLCCCSGTDGSGTHVLQTMDPWQYPYDEPDYTCTVDLSLLEEYGCRYLYLSSTRTGNIKIQSNMVYVSTEVRYPQTEEQILSWEGLSERNTVTLENGYSTKMLEVVTSGNKIRLYNAPETICRWTLQSAESSQKKYGWGIQSSEQETAAVWKSDADGNGDAFFAEAFATWSDEYAVQHCGTMNGWTGTGEIVSIAGKNRFRDIFEGSLDTNILFLKDTINGDALCADDIYTELPSGTEAGSRLSLIKEIRAGAGDDVIDMTSSRYEYSGGGIVIRGGKGNDVIWGGYGDNVLLGDEGNDRIIGGSVNDVIAGGAGNDTLHGGGGKDIFTFCKEWGCDTVEQLDGGCVTLWFASGNEENWNAQTKTYTDGTNSVTVSGTEDITLKFGDDDSLLYDKLSSAGCFDAYSTRTVFGQTQGVAAEL